MKLRSIFNCLKPALILAVFGSFQPSYSDTRTYAATTDFPVIDAGIAPYYSEAPARLSLAINAADESCRNLFARAEVVYDGNEGIHDITIVVLAELDGEADYRLLVNGVLVGTATHPEVSVDYTVARHTFPDIIIPVGAVLGVESLANTNGNIPEGDGTAFARGRWTALELAEINPAEEPVVQPPTDIDLNLLLTSSKMSANQNEAFQLHITASNTASSITATQPEESISILLQALSVVLADQCDETALGLRCTFPELTAGTSYSTSLPLMSTDEVQTLATQAFVSTDQNDRDETNNMANLTIIVNNSEVEPEPEQPADSGALAQATHIPRSSGGGLSLYWMLLLLPEILRTKHPSYVYLSRAFLARSKTACIPAPSSVSIIDRSCFT
jgi:hypothetical protein